MNKVQRYLKQLTVIERKNSPNDFFYEGDFYTRLYMPETGRLVLKGDTANDDIIIEQGNGFVCWGVVTLTLNPVLQPRHRMGRYANVCAC